MVTAPLLKLMLSICQILFIYRFVLVGEFSFGETTVKPGHNYVVFRSLN